MRRAAAIFFLTVFIFSLRGYSLELHYCHGKMTDMSLFGHTDCVCDTGSEVTEKPVMACHQKKANPLKNHAVGKEDCCKTEFLTYTPVKLKAAATSKTELVKKIAVLNPFFLLSLIQPSDKAEAKTAYIPPLLEKDISVLFRTLLI